MAGTAAHGAATSPVPAPPAATLVVLPHLRSQLVGAASPQGAALLQAPQRPWVEGRGASPVVAQRRVGAGWGAAAVVGGPQGEGDGVRLVAVGG